MSQFNLKAIEFQIASEVKCDSEGKGVYSIRAIARLASVDQSTLVKALKIGDGISQSKIAQSLIQHGFESGDISPSKIFQSLIQYGFESGDFIARSVANPVSFS